MSKELETLELCYKEMQTQYDYGYIVRDRSRYRIVMREARRVIKNAHRKQRLKAKTSTLFGFLPWLKK